ncbi:MAG: putative peptidoglycan lipid II flippase [Phenylobacterium sp.]|jgi:putative peptidoglycan lipid II flippase
MTMISRVLGLVRDVVIATMVGTSAGADVYFFANRIPNFLRRLFAEGAFAQAFVPVMSEVKEKHGDDAVRELFAKVSGTLGVVVTIVTLLGVLGSSVIVAVFGFNWFLQWFNGTGEGKFEMASLMLKITFPYLWFISLVALSGAILNTYNKFAAAAFTPVLLNIAIIVSAWLLSSSFEVPAMSLAIGVFIGGLVQFLFQLPFLAKQGLLVRPRWAWHDEQVKKIRTLMLPAIFGVSVNQINLLVDTIIASFLVTGSISWLYYADRLIEFPLGLFGIGIATVILPALSRQHVNNDPQQFSRTMDWGVRFIAVMGAPAMVGLMIMAKPIIAVLYLRGEFSESAVEMVSHSLIAYACGLLSYMMIKVLAPGYYSRQDIKTPVRFGIIAMVANMVLNLILVQFLAYVGLALATAMSATLNAFLLYRGLKQQQVYQFSALTLRFFAKLLLAVSAMAVVLLTITPAIQVWYDMDLLSKISWLMFYIGCGAASYLAVLVLLGVRLADFKSS